MSRIMQIRVPWQASESLAAALQRVEGVVGLTVQRGASIKPPGDIISIDSSNEGMHRVFRLLNERGIGETCGSVVTCEPRSILSASDAGVLETETNEMVWPEMAYQLRQETNISANFLLTMLFSGAIAAAGLWTDTLQPVIGAMVIAAGFEPIIRIPFGLMGQSGRSARLGIASVLVGYGTLALGAALGLLILQQIEPRTAPLQALRWVQYWSGLSPTPVLTALVAGAAGAVIISSGRSVLTAGVMITLALIPAMTITGMAAAAGDVTLVGDALLRWTVEAACVATAGAALFLSKRLIQHRSPS